MPWSNGSFSRTDGTRNGSTVWMQAKNAGVKIVSADHDVHDQDLADGIDAALAKDGSNAATDDLDLGSHKITNLASGSSGTDALAVGQMLAVTAGGTANAITGTLTPAPAAYVSGMAYAFTATAANTDAVTLNLNSLGAKDLKKAGSSGLAALAAGDIQTGQVVTAVYDGTQFVLTSPVADLSPIPAGALMPYAGGTAPTGWHFCDGSALSRTTYAALFDAIGTTYGAGDGSTTFNLPDTGGRVIAGKEGTATRLTSGVSGVDGATLGATGGDQRVQQHKHTLTDPGHLHTVGIATVTGYGSGTGGGASGGSTDTDSKTTGITMADFGSGAAQNVQPTLVLNYIIKT